MERPEAFAEGFPETHMELYINGVLTEFSAPLTIAELLVRHKLKPEAVVVEHNLRVPRKEEYAHISLQNGDRVEIVKFMGGG
jgi:sulfur carrier protein